MAVSLNTATPEDANDVIGYCHEYVVQLNREGSIISQKLNDNNTNTLILGNKGDLSITHFTFDFSDSIFDTNIGDFNCFLQVNNGVKTLRYQLTYQSGTIFTWTVPEALTNPDTDFALRYICTLSLEEKDQSGGSINSNIEVWVSNNFIMSVNDSIWSDAYAARLDQPEEGHSDTNVILKTPITFTIDSNHYRLTASSTKLGNKGDAYMRTLQIYTNQDFDEGLKDVYCITKAPNGAEKYVKFSSKPSAESITYYSSILGVECTHPGTCQMLIVACSPDKQKRWVSNTLTFNIENTIFTSGT